MADKRRRKTGIALDEDDIAAAEDAWKRAADLNAAERRKPKGLIVGRPHLVTIKPAHLDALSGTNQALYWRDLLGRVRAFARYRKFLLTYVWTRESTRPPGNPQTVRKAVRKIDGSKGEHMHLLIYLPPPLIEPFRKSVAGRGGNVREVHIEPAWHSGWLMRNGNIGSAIRYITKNSPRASWKKRRGYQLGGPVHGARWGRTRNLAPP